ncbi:MAG: hypothetical protein OER82_02065, partial [Nitrosopumilus sp.]|nr:hypothetical protein [Nitrosopumilus sp.]
MTQSRHWLFTFFKNKSLSKNRAIRISILDFELIKMSSSESEVNRNNNEQITVKKSTFNIVIIG